MKQNRKTKSLLTASVGLLSATTVVAPLASMSSCANTDTNLEFAADKEYGVTGTTYTDLRDEFKTQYQAQLSLTMEEKEVKKRVAYLEKQLTYLDEIKNQKTHGFTTLTTTMMKFAKEGVDLGGKSYGEYKINLTRKTNAQWSQLDTIFNSWKGAFKQYMLNSDIPLSTIVKVMQDAQNKFVALKNNLIETCDDALDGVIKGKELLITCFDDVSDEIALVSATLQLKELMSQYVFDTKTDDYACLDNLTNPDKTQFYRDDFKEGNILTDETMNRLFAITRKDDGQPVEFKNTLAKGYTIQPKLVKVSTNIYTNTNTFQIDFGLVKTSYLGKYNKDQLVGVTAHRFSADNWDAINETSGDITLAEIIKSFEIQPIEYPIYLSKIGEQETLKTAYFNKDSERGFISFKWDNENADNQAYESFFDNATQNPNGTWTAKLTSNSLINSNLMISDNVSENDSYRFMKDIYKSRESLINNSELIHLEKLDDLFLSACEVSANATIDETNTSHKVVTIDNFYANYSNSIYKDQENGKLALENTTDYQQFQNECVNHQVSNAFFEKVNTKFNEVAVFVKQFDASIANDDSDSGIDELANELTKELLGTTVALVAGFGAVAAIIFRVWAPWNPEGKTKLMNLVTAILLACSVTAQIVLYFLWFDKYFKPMQAHFDDHSEFEDKSTKSDFVHDLLTSSTYFVLLNDDGSYNKKEFNAKKEAFSKLTMEEMLDEYRNYSCIKTNGSKLHDDWAEYQELLLKYNLDPEEIRKKMDEWIFGGKYWIIQSGLTILNVFFGIALARWVKVVKRNKEVDEYEAEIARKEAELARQEDLKMLYENYLRGGSGPAVKATELFQALAYKMTYYPIMFETAQLIPLALEFWKKITIIMEMEIWNGKKPLNDELALKRATDLRDDINRRFIKNKKYFVDPSQPWDINKLIEILG